MKPRLMNLFWFKNTFKEISSTQQNGTNIVEPIFKNFICPKWFNTNLMFMGLIKWHKRISLWEIKNGHLSQNVFVIIFAALKGCYPATDSKVYILLGDISPCDICSADWVTPGLRTCALDTTYLATVNYKLQICYHLLTYYLAQVTEHKYQMTVPYFDGDILVTSLNVYSPPAPTSPSLYIDLCTVYPLFHLILLILTISPVQSDRAWPLWHCVTLCDTV